MRAWSIIACLVLFSWASAQAETKWVTFHCEPNDAKVFLEVGSAKPYLLGTVGENLALDLSLFDGRRNVRITFRRSGWLDETRSLQQEPVQSRYFDTRDRYPEASQGPVRLTAKTDLASRSEQIRYYGWRHRVGLSLSLLIATLGAGFGWRRYAWQRTQARRGQKLDEMVATLDSKDPYSGTVLGSYRLLEKLGEGGMSVVYRAVSNESLQHEVAIKILDPRLAKDEASVKRFRREIQICQGLNHANIMQLYDFGRQDDIWYLVMELLRGHTLSQELDQGLLDPAQVSQFCEPLVKALGYLHDKEIVHRDLKPENVFLTDQGKLKLMDFGIARGEAYTVATATQGGLGTPAYMSPEQVEGRFEAASDQYALGCMVYEMLTGGPPFTDPDPFTLAFKHVGEVPRRVRTLVPEVPEELDNVVMRLLAKRPEQRFRSMEEAGEALVAACSAA